MRRVLKGLAKSDRREIWGEKPPVGVLRKDIFCRQRDPPNKVKANLTDLPGNGVDGDGRCAHTEGVLAGLSALHGSNCNETKRRRCGFA